MANLEGKTTELLMGESNPNHPEERHVHLEVIRRLRRQLEEHEDEIAELRCASRLLNDRLVKQANIIDAEQSRRKQLEGLLGRARLIVKMSHLQEHKSHRKNLLPPMTVMPGCAVCAVLLETERSSS